MILLSPPEIFSRYCLIGYLVVRYPARLSRNSSHTAAGKPMEEAVPKLLFVIIALFFGLVTSAQADSSTECDSRCKAAQHPQAAKPAVPDMVCIFFVQPEPNTVVLTLTLPDGKARIYSRLKGREDRICVGRHWLVKSVAASLCNLTTGSTEYSTADVALLAQKPKDSHELTGCLFGAAKCAHQMDLP